MLEYLAGSTHVLDIFNLVACFDLLFTVAVPCMLQTLQSPSIGITAAFDPKVADFSKISETPLFVTQVLQSVRASCANNSAFEL